MMRIAVVGAGVIGLAITRALLRRGCEVVCLEADRPMAARSAGSSRIFRVAHGDPALVAFAIRARSLWSDWNDDYAALFAHRHAPHLSRHRRTPQLLWRTRLCVTGPVADGWATAMARAGAPYTFFDEPSFTWPGQLPGVATGPLLLDSEAGVIDAEAVARYLRGAVGQSLRLDRVERLTPAADQATVRTTAGRYEVDRVVLAAGQGTRELAAQAGIDAPGALAHHARFTFPLRYRADRPMSWLDRSESWRPGVTLYQHMSGVNRWSVGAHFGDEEAAWTDGRDAVTDRSREVVRCYVREVLHGVGDDVLETVYCTFIPGLHDGIHAHRSGPVTAIWGNNLFKHVPAIAEVVAGAVVDDTHPLLPRGL